MYLCKNCGNREFFEEMNDVKTMLTLDEETGEIVSSMDEIVCCKEIICADCGASSNDDYIVNRETGEPIVFVEY